MGQQIAGFDALRSTGNNEKSANIKKVTFSPTPEKSASISGANSSRLELFGRIDGEINKALRTPVESTDRGSRCDVLADALVKIIADSNESFKLELIVRYGRSFLLNYADGKTFHHRQKLLLKQIATLDVDSQKKAAHSIRYGYAKNLDAEVDKFLSSKGVSSANEKPGKIVFRPSGPAFTKD